MKRIITFLFITLLNFTSYGFEIDAKYSVLIDAESLEILYQKNAFDKMAPSSMSKMVTAYIVFDYLNKGNLKLTDRFNHSEKAWKTEGSRMFISVNSSVTIEDLLRGLIIQSGNDAAVNLAEGISGSEEEFAELMTSYAKKLGMHGSHFANSTGIPHPQHYTTAYDLALIAYRTITDFPEYYKYYQEKDFTYNNIRQPNRNILLTTYHGADGVKTGHADEAGYGLTASSIRNGRRLIAVANGLRTSREAASECEKLLNYGFMNFKNVAIANKNEPLYSVKVVYGNQEKLLMVPNKNIVLSVPLSVSQNLVYKVKYESPIFAPIKQGDKVAELEISDKENKFSKTIDLFAGNDVDKVNMIFRFFYNIKYKLLGV